jgi:ubiquinol-cytochrome c reductase cytochrome b subunit
MVLGAKHVESPFIELGQLSTVFYFSYFIIIVPFISVLENLLMGLSSKSINQNSTFTSKTK